MFSFVRSLIQVLQQDKYFSVGFSACNQYAGNESSVVTVKIPDMSNVNLLYVLGGKKKSSFVPRFEVLSLSQPSQA